MKILVLNCGSSSLKCQLIDMEKNERIMKGNYERIGGNRSNLRFNVRGNKTEIEQDTDFLAHIMMEIRGYARSHGLSPDDTLKEVANWILAVLEIATFNGRDGD